MMLLNYSSTDYIKDKYTYIYYTIFPRRIMLGVITPSELLVLK
jgi:hypothetical protein